MRLLLRGARVSAEPDGARAGDGGPPTTRAAEVLVEDGRIAGVTLVGGGREPAPPMAADEIVDLHGALLIPALAEPHIHLDKAFSAAVSGAGDGTLRGAMAAYERVLRARGGPTVADPQEHAGAARAARALARLVGAGATAVRAHTGCGRLAGTACVASMVELRARAAAVVDLQVVAHVGGPDPDESWSSHVRRLRAALDSGADVVGGNPSIEMHPDVALDACLSVAVERGVPADFHIDETTDSGVFMLRRLARVARGCGVPVTASHCVSLGSQPAQVIAEVCAELAAAQVQVTALPQTNLYLQGRDTPAGRPIPRGTAPVGALLAAGVTVAVGGDNVQDAYNPVGRLDPLDTAAVAVLALQIDPWTAFESVSVRARAAMGLPPAALQVGDLADFVAVEAADLAAAVADAPTERTVWHRGVPVVRTVVSSSGTALDLLVGEVR